MPYIMVLNDGETYTNLAGCKIVRISDALANDPDELEVELHELARAPYPFDHVSGDLSLVEVFEGEPRWDDDLEADCGV